MRNKSNMNHQLYSNMTKHWGSKMHDTGLDVFIHIGKSTSGVNLIFSFSIQVSKDRNLIISMSKM